VHGGGRVAELARHAAQLRLQRDQSASAVTGRWLK
jgi:hypothetical protein